MKKGTLGKPKNRYLSKIQKAKPPQKIKKDYCKAKGTGLGLGFLMLTKLLTRLMEFYHQSNVTYGD